LACMWPLDWFSEAQFLGSLCLVRVSHYAPRWCVVSTFTYASSFCSMSHAK
jgi:hypothetical protein